MGIKSWLEKLGKNTGKVIAKVVPDLNIPPEDLETYKRMEINKLLKNNKNPTQEDFRDASELKKDIKRYLNWQQREEANGDEYGCPPKKGR